ncbi:TniB family NTP-binding protein [Shewanella sp. 0m-8]
MNVSLPLPIDIGGNISQKLDLNQMPKRCVEYLFMTIEHSGFEKATAALEACYELSGLESNGCILTGPPGVGKSRAIRSFVTDIYYQDCNRATTELTPLPILSIRVPGKPTLLRVIEKILQSAGDLSPTTRSTQSAQTRLDRLIVQRKVRMIIFDEFQHLLRKNAMVRTNDVLSFIKVLMDDHRLSVVFAGLPEGEDALTDFPELRQRLSFVDAKLYPFSLEKNGPSNRDDFVAYLLAMQEKFAELNVKVIPIVSKDMVPRLWLATKGTPRHINQFFMRMLNQYKEGDFIDKEKFQELFKTCPFHRALGTFEPFTAPSEQVKNKINDIKE